LQIVMRRTADPLLLLLLLLPLQGCNCCCLCGTLSWQLPLAGRIHPGRVVRCHEGCITERLAAAAGSLAAARYTALLQLLKCPLQGSFHLLQTTLRRLSTQAVTPQPRPHADARHPSLLVMLTAMVLQQP
jgi:hypothetical protein